MPKKLLYKDFKIESFSFENENGKFADEANIKSLEGFDFGQTYFCPHCVKKHELYKEADISKEMLEKVIAAEVEGETDDYICCISGCENENALQSTIFTKDCVLVR